MKTDILSRIIERKKIEVAGAMAKTPLHVLRRQAGISRVVRPFYQQLRTPGPSDVNIIAEIKRASPSKGLIRADLDAGAYAAAYQAGGAIAISVLTDGFFFNGDLEDLKAARRSCDLPVLRKEFIVSDYQIYESAAAGADAVLLIVRILAPPVLEQFITLAADLGLDALVEVYEGKDLEIAHRAGATLIGINNRNLENFNTDIHRAEALVSQLSSSRTAVAASGIRNRSNIAQNRRAGIFNFLVGECLVRAEDPKRAVASLLKDGI
ncbi:MAG: indole-3-glycerol phosphate synthase TrpC [Desulfobacteraceae bacterium]|nr:indole-3-glycerol phosphate synthase TrpC [Desulfobacteraceae bacterium]